MDAASDLPALPRRTGARERWSTGHDLLVTTLRGHGVDLNDDDARIVESIAGWETASVRTICSWIVRAHFAARGE